MGDVTSQDIMAATGISNVVTLTRWHQMGLIPPPDVRTHPNGRGKIAYWPDWVLERCVRIKQLVNAGRKLADIHNSLGNDWQSEERQSKRRYIFKEACETLERRAAIINLRESLEHLLHSWTSMLQKRVRKTSIPLLSIEMIEQALMLVEQGINPVFVFDQGNSFITADFVVSQKLSQHPIISRPILVVPLFDEITKLFKGQAELPVEPTIIPSRHVRSVGTNEDVETTFIYLDDWTFDLEHGKGKKRRR